VVSTLHSPLSQIKIDILSHFKRSQYFVSISNAQRKPLPDLQYIQTIYHGVDTLSLRFNENPKHDDILFTGRIVPEKGIVMGIALAQKLNLKINVFGSANEKSNFWKREVKFQINNPLVNYRGYVPEDEVIDNYQNAKVYLFPIQWEEAFGLVMIESMACGTPVVAFARGSVPEIVVDGVTGFIVNPSDDDIRGDWIIKKTGMEGLCRAVERIYNLSKDDYRKMRQACRKHVEEHFTVEKMVDNYEKVYREIIDASR